MKLPPTQADGTVLSGFVTAGADIFARTLIGAGIAIISAAGITVGAGAANGTDDTGASTVLAVGVSAIVAAAIPDQAGNSRPALTKVTCAMAANAAELIEDIVISNHAPFFNEFFFDTDQQIVLANRRAPLSFRAHGSVTHHVD